MTKRSNRNPKRQQPGRPTADGDPPPGKSAPALACSPDAQHSSPGFSIAIWLPGAMQRTAKEVGSARSRAVTTSRSLPPDPIPDTPTIDFIYPPCLP